MKQGEFGVVTSTPYRGKIAFKAYDNIVVALDDGNTWSMPCPNEVEIFPKGTKIEITVGE